MSYLTFKLNRKPIDELVKLPAQIIIKSTQSRTHVVEIDCSIITFKVVANTVFKSYFLYWN